MGHILEKVKKAIDIEIESLQNFRLKLDPRFEDAIQLIMEMKGKVIITGVGKSGDIAKKISSTMTSTGTEAIFLHPTDATHGDAGLIKKSESVTSVIRSSGTKSFLPLFDEFPMVHKLIGLSTVDIRYFDETLPTFCICTFGLIIQFSVWCLDGFAVIIENSKISNTAGSVLGLTNLSI